MPTHEVETAEAHEAAALRPGGGGAAEKRAYVRRMFSEIAPTYDALNHLLSLNVDRRWRRQALAALDWTRRPDGLYLDLCAGTLDVATALASSAGFAGSVLGADFAEPMLRAGLARAPLADGSVAGAVVAFGIRNLADLDAGLRETHRVLVRGGRFVILEFSTPPSWPARAVYHAYFHHVLPLVGGLLSGHRTAYHYLPESVANFPSGRELAARMTRAGFERVEWRPLTLGIAALHVGVKP